MKKNKTILIIEDDEVLLRAIYLLFRKSNYTIATATDGESGLEIAERLKPNLILLDIVLPKINGIDVLRSLKKNDITKKIPVIILSNVDDAREKISAKELGVLAYFIKADSKVEEIANFVKKNIGR